MGIYINKGNEEFKIAHKGEYVDKSGLIAEVNNTLFTIRATCFLWESTTLNINLLKF